jgi:pyruvate/2-oxoglutarate dehydrogenase complex dihydrolipoamide acyltransferase (E2) component
LSQASDIKVPDLGDFSDVEVIEVLVKSGDRVAKEDGLITLETDKAAMDVPAEREGVIEEITVSVGDKVNSGDVIGRMKAGGDAGDDESKQEEGGRCGDCGECHGVCVHRVSHSIDSVGPHVVARGRERRR